MSLPTAAPPAFASAPAAVAHTPEPGVRVWAVVPCGGSGSRAGAGLPKQYRPLAGWPVVGHTLNALAQVPALAGCLLAVAPGDDAVNGPFAESALPGLAQLPAVAQRASGWLQIHPCAGATRADTVRHALQVLQAQGVAATDWVLVHDAARCLVRPETVAALVSACQGDAVGGLLALPLPDTMKQAVDGRAHQTLDRSDKWLAQTPQMFRLGALLDALLAAQAAADGGACVTDEASAMERQGHRPLLVQGRADNIKLTYAEDFDWALALLNARTPAAQPAPVDWQAFARLRVGEGWDCHALVPGRPLMLGGICVPHTHGLLGHSDADVLLHAVTDALLGGAGLGDIGRHFPDTDPRFKGADSAVLLSHAVARVRAAGFEPVNLDATIVAQAPKLAPHLPAMGLRLAELTGLPADAVNVKAKTAERMGPVGEGLSMEARATALLVRRS